VVRIVDGHDTDPRPAGFREAVGDVGDEPVVILVDTYELLQPVIAPGSSRDLLVGEPVVALGAPLGLVDTVQQASSARWTARSPFPPQKDRPPTWWAPSRPTPPSTPATAAAPSSTAKPS